MLLSSVKTKCREGVPIQVQLKIKRTSFPDQDKWTKAQTKGLGGQEENSGGTRADLNTGMAWMTVTNNTDTNHEQKPILSTIND